MYLKMPRKAWGSDFCTQTMVQDWARELQPSIVEEHWWGKGNWHLHGILVNSYVHSQSFQSSLTLLWPHGLQPSRLLCPWDSPGKNTAMLSSRGSSQPRNQTHVSCISFIACPKEVSLPTPSPWKITALGSSEHEQKSHVTMESEHWQKKHFSWSEECSRCKIRQLRKAQPGYTVPLLQDTPEDWLSHVHVPV